jgi:uncharacterized integral membrane protein
MSATSPIGWSPCDPEVRSSTAADSSWVGVPRRVGGRGLLSRSIPTEEVAMSYVRNDAPEAESKSPSPRLILAIVLGVVALIFVFQNSTSREINFLLWDMSAPTWLWMLILLAVGVAIGSIFPWGRRRKKDD